MQKKLVEFSFGIWGFILLMTFIVFVFNFYGIIPNNMDTPMRLILTVIEVVAFVIGALGMLLQEKQ